MERQALGKGLAALISDQNDQTMVKEIPIEYITANPYQPRRVFDNESLTELANSIQAVGILSPILVRQIGNDRFELIAGERRLRACTLIGFKKISAIVHTADDLKMIEWALIENLQREDINPIDAAVAYKKLIEEFSMTHEQIAERVGKSRSSITNTLRLLNLSDTILDSLKSGAISEGHAKALLSVKDSDKQQSLLDDILLNSLSVRETERRIKQLSEPTTETNEQASQNTSKTHSSNSAYRDVEEKLSEILGAKVVIKSAKPVSKIVIDFFNDEDLTRITDLLGLSE